MHFSTVKCTPIRCNYLPITIVKTWLHESSSAQHIITICWTTGMRDQEGSVFASSAHPTAAPGVSALMTLTLLRQYKSSSIYQAVQAGTLSRISCSAFSAVSPASASHKEGVLPMETCSWKCWGSLGCLEPICLFPTFAVCLRCWPKADAEVLSRSCYKWAQNMY